MTDWKSYFLAEIGMTGFPKWLHESQRGFWQGLESRFFCYILYLVVFEEDIHNLQKIHKIVTFNVNLC